MDYPLDKSAYLICGDDEFRISNSVSELLDRLVPEAEREFGLDRIDGRVDTVDATVEMLRAVRDALVSDGLFSAGNKTVWLRDPSFLTNDRIGKSETVKAPLAELISAIKAGFGDGVRLVVSTVKINRASAFFKAFAGGHCHVTDYKIGDRASDKAAAAKELLGEYLPKNGISMDAAVRQFFLSRVGTDSRRIVSELGKLACYCGDRKEVTADDIRDIVSDGAVPEFWELSEAFCSRDAKGLVKQVRIQLEQGANAIGLLSSLFTAVNDLLALREGRDRRWAAPSQGRLGWDALPPEIYEGLETLDRGPLAMAGFSLRKKEEQSSLWTLRELRAARHCLLELREALVSSALPEDFLLETKLLQAIGLKRMKV